MPTPFPLVRDVPPGIPETLCNPLGPRFVTGRSPTGGLRPHKNPGLAPARSLPSVLLLPDAIVTL